MKRQQTIRLHRLRFLSVALMLQVTTVIALTAQQQDSTQWYVAQDTTRSSVMLQGGYHYSGRSMVMVGLGWLTERMGGHHPFSTVVSASIGFSISSHIATIPTLSAWVAGGAGAMGFCLDLAYVIDGERSGVLLRPVIGMGIVGFRFAYGYNLKGYNVEAVGTHTFILELPLYKRNN